MNARPWNAIVGGVLGTAVLTLMMYVLAPMMLGRPMDIAAMLSRMLGGSWALGMLMHLLNGIIIFPLIYLYLLAGIFPGQPWLKGTLWGPLLWVLLEVVAMPRWVADCSASTPGARWRSSRRSSPTSYTARSLAN